MLFVKVMIYLSMKGELSVIMVMEDCQCSYTGSSDPEATELTTRPGRIVMQEIDFNTT